MKKEFSEVLKKESSKSSKMKELYNLGMGIKEISEVMGVRYNFVYNVVSDMCRVDKLELRVKKTGSGDSKKEKIIELIKGGMNNVDISSKLGIKYNYVFKVRKEFENK